MAKIDIYTKGYCPYCMRAKALLAEKGDRALMKLKLTKSLSLDQK